MQKESLLTTMPKLIMSVVLIVGIGAVLGLLSFFISMPKGEVVIDDEIDKEEIREDKIIKDEMEDWKTYNTQYSSLTLYKNLENPFTFKYPTNWFLAETKGGVDIYSFQSTQGYGVGTLKEGQFKTEIWLLYYPNNLNNPSILEWCDKELNSYSSHKDIKKIFLRREKIINGLNIAEIEFEVTGLERINGRFICFEGKRNNMVILGHPLNSEHMKIFNQIISTFKFIENSDSSKTQTLIQLMNKNLDFKNFMDEVFKVNPELSIENFSILKSQNIEITNHSYDTFYIPEDKNDPRWIFSPDGTRAVSIYGLFGEPDSSLDLYNWKGDEKTDNLEFCGTPCSYWVVYWLNNEQFVFIKNTEAYIEIEKEIKYAVSIHFYDIENNIKINYQSQALDKDIIKPDILEWRERLFNVCKKSFKGGGFCSEIK